MKCNDTHIWLKIKGDLFNFKDDLFLCICYFPPSNSSRQGIIDINGYDVLLDNLVYFQNNYDNKCNFMIVGDLNSRIGNQCDFVTNDLDTHMNLLPDDYVQDQSIPRKSQDSITNSNGYMLLDFLKQSGLRVANGRVCEDKNIGAMTFVGSRGSSIVDYCIVNVELFQEFSSFYIHDPNILSDHCLIEFSLLAKHLPENIEEDVHHDFISKVYKWDKNLKDKYIQSLSAECFKNSLSHLTSMLKNSDAKEDVDASISTFIDLLDNVCSPLFGKKVFQSDNTDKKVRKENNAVNQDESCNDKRKDFYRKLNIFRKCKSDINKQNLLKSRTEYRNTVRKYNLEQDRVKTAKLLNAKVKNAKEYWKLLKESVASSKPKNLTIDIFDKYFKAINNPEDPFFQADEDILYFNDRFVNDEAQVMFDELNVDITSNEIKKAIAQLKQNRSGGPDALLNEFFIHGAEQLLPYLHELFNTILKTGYFPKQWSEGYIVPIHKKGKLDDVNNFRGVTLLSTFGKLFTRILNNRLTQWAEEYAIYIEAQAGFRANMSTTDNIFVLHGLINHFINSGNKLYCAFVDFTKAFDYVNRDVIWYKLIKIGVRGKILNVIKSMYEQVKSKVKLNNAVSEGFESMLGVRQGECLSPFLFAMYLNDLEEVYIHKGYEGIEIGMVKLFLLLYADDIILFAATAEELQSSLDILYDYSKRWKLKVNTEKTKILIFRKGGILSRTLAFYYDNV
ncbi:MAG: reverse transcriptase family protein, partial [Candidatus Thiodiazotropha sp.]